MAVLFPPGEFRELKKLLLIYGWGQKNLLTKLDILNQDFQAFHSNNPIENIRSRIKAPESIAQKLFTQNLELTAANARAHVKDIAGVRIICTFAKDIYVLAEILRSMPHTKVISEKDYVSSPKPSGYRGYHVAMEMPVYYSGEVENIPVEVQLRTAAMDFWATLEHKVKYKYDEHIPPHLSDELVSCADQIAKLDDRMFIIHNTISILNSNGQHE
ncbi:MAG: GTP pyrophosphokinase family protein [Oscillospiraceae bacterium]|nr:GTP pyrophosphokinase family protein [Oscillospiraceae bacterium]